MLNTLSNRLIFTVLVLLSIAAMAIALVLDKYLQLEPCPLCMTQRAVVVVGGLFALLGALHNPRGWGRRTYGCLCLLAAAAGMAVAGRHVWLQHLPPDQVPACGPSLNYMLETLPFSETLKIVLMGDGNCAETVWTLLGLSIPEQTLGLFTVVAAISLWLTLRRSA